jgi:hypothetical protein
MFWFRFPTAKKGPLKRRPKSLLSSIGMTMTPLAEIDPLMEKRLNSLSPATKELPFAKLIKLTGGPK